MSATAANGEQSATQGGCLRIARPLFIVGFIALCVHASNAPPPIAEGLPKDYQAAEQMERDDSLPLTSFYRAPKLLTDTEPGTLLRQEEVRDFKLPPGTKATRILYRSLNAAGMDVVSSGVVITPPGGAPPGGWPVIAWAHGTSGVARQCAPSLMKSLWYGDEGLSDMVLGGFAVVATDYHGLGTEGEHEYLNRVAQANDVIYSIPAALKAIPGLSARWVVDGHSQGGLAAWGVAEIESTLNDNNYLGAVSISGSTSLEDWVTHINEVDGGNMYLTYLAFGIHARHPKFEVSEILTSTALKPYAKSTSAGCWYAGYALYKGTARGTMFKPDWMANPSVRQSMLEWEEGTTRVTKPILVLTGEADQTVPFEGAKKIVRRACQAGGRILFKSYPGLDHDPTMVKSMPDQLRWIRDRFEGKNFTGNCSAT